MSERIRVPKTTYHLDRIQRLVANEIPPPAVAKLIGIVPVVAELGRVVFDLDAGPQHANPMGTLHGGIICDLADAAMGMAMATTLEADETFTTIDLTAKYFKPVWKARLRATGQVTKRTRSLGLIECDVLDESESLVAKVFSTCMVLRGDEAKGR
jgi:uncharacterized protein (TIGR00369 family)